VLEVVSKKNKKLNLKPQQIKQNMWIFVNSLIENPSFDSQTKETLTTKPSTFGSSCELSASFHKKVAQSDLIEAVTQAAQIKEQLELRKKMGTSKKKQRLIGIPKLEDANDAGTKNGHHCTLILTEGDSAKSLALSGIQVMGRDRFGVFPLRGKLLNVREVSNKQLMENQEIQNVIKILGLQLGAIYDDASSLRYGQVMIMTDQDQDGSHIKGLIINFFHHFWPSLLKLKNFLVEFVTPIIKAVRGPERHCFFTIQEFERWAAA